MWRVLGHERAVELLDRSLREGRLSHAYLFVGPPHVGRMTLAANLAQALNCSEEERPCGDCSQCRRIAEGKHPDVQVIGIGGESPRTEVGIDRIRELQHSSSLPPYEGRVKVFIIDGVERLSTEASNCLLKILEEPPPRVTIIGLTENERLLLPTITSRCQILELRPLPTVLIEEELRKKTDPREAETIARLSRGRPGWAFSALADGRILEERRKGLEDAIRIWGAGVNERFAYAAKLASGFGRTRDLEALNLWLSLWRDMLLVRGGAGEYITNIDQEGVLREEARGYNIREIKGFIQSIQEARWQLQENANPRLVLEVLMLDIPQKGRGV